MSSFPPSYPSSENSHRQDSDNLGRSFLNHLWSLSSAIEPGCSIVELQPTDLHDKFTEK